MGVMLPRGLLARNNFRFPVNRRPDLVGAHYFSPASKL
jgi:hypothetical protein